MKGVPISLKLEMHVHVHRHLGIDGRLAPYELNVINVHVPFGDATDRFFKHLMEAYRQLANIGPTIIIGDFNGAPTMDDRGG